MRQGQRHQSKRPGVKAALLLFQMMAVFATTKNTFNTLKPTATKLQKHDQHLFKAYRMVNEVIECMKTARKTTDATYSYWYDKVLNLAKNIGVKETIPKKTRLQRNRNNTPSASPIEHYKGIVVIPLLDSFVSQKGERFTGDRCHSCVLLCLLPSVMLSYPVKHSKHIEGMLHWERDLPSPRSLGSELRKWNGLWQGKKDEVQGLEGESLTSAQFPATFFSLSVLVTTTLFQISTTS